MKARPNYLMFLLLILVSCGKPINDKSDQKSPAKNKLEIGVLERPLFGIRMFMNFDYLPLQGDVKNKKRFWSGDSWKLVNGSINYRWNSPGLEGRFAPSPHPRTLRNLTLEDLKRLAPSEKYDLLKGRYDFPLKFEVDQNIPLVPEDWEGLCHGWAGASLNHKEPSPKNIMGPDGFLIPFGSADIKALLSYYYAGLLIGEDEQLGKRCDLRGILPEDFCDDDVTPVDFHLILANKLGLRGDSIIMDLERYREVWNHPITSYQSKILKSSKLPMNEKLLRIQTTLNYIDVVETSSWEKTNGTARQITSSLQLEYELKLDSAGNMSEGKWISRARPDFIWSIAKVQNFTGYLSDLSRLIDD